MTDNTHIPVPRRKSSQKELGLIRKIYSLLKVTFFFFPPELKGTALPIYTVPTRHHTMVIIESPRTSHTNTQRW